LRSASPAISLSDEFISTNQNPFIPMAYSVHLLTTPADCDSLLAYAQERLRVLRHRESVSSYASDTKAMGATDLADELAELHEDIAFYTDRLASMGVSETRIKRENELRKAIDRRDELLSRQGAEGAVALLKRELEKGETTARIAEIETFIAAVTERKSRL
jgi:hypothetical protein